MNFKPLGSRDVAEQVISAALCTLASGLAGIAVDLLRRKLKLEPAKDEAESEV